MRKKVATGLMLVLALSAQGVYAQGQDAEGDRYAGSGQDSVAEGGQAAADSAAMNESFTYTVQEPKITGAGTSVARKNKLPPPILKEENVEDVPYTLGPNDIITITVRRHPEFSGQFSLGPDNKIQYPFVGDIDLSGLTKQQAIAEIKVSLSEYVAAPEVDIVISAYNSKSIYLVGMVNRPGKYPIKGQTMPLREAVLSAGLPRENIASLRRTLIIRPQENGKIRVKRVNLLKLLYHGDLRLNYDLHSGDIVYLPSTVVYKVSTVLDQVLNPFFKAATVHREYQDIQDNN